ncbi:MAG: 30S ribosomal protein S16 [Planctomycetota bacterium]
MAVKLRLTRFGRLNHPTYRVCAADSRSKRDGRVIETLGYYLPKAPRQQDQVNLEAERIRYWLSVGAQPSETVAGLIRRAGIELPQHAAKKSAKRKAGAAKRSGAKPGDFSPPRSLGTGRKAKAKWRAKHVKKEA